MLFRGAIERTHMPDLQLVVDGQELTADWTDENTTTRDAIGAALPLEGDASRWGDELYFRTGIDVAPETTQTEVPVGSIAYWPQGNAICLFWGSTPASHNQEPRAAAPVAVVATVNDVSPPSEIQGGATNRIEAV
jgi:hypothetical protein